MVQTARSFRIEQANRHRKRHTLSRVDTLADPIVAFPPVLEGSDQDLLGGTFEQVPAST